MNARTMAARLANTTLRLIKKQLSVRSVTLYSDSEISLAWLASPSLDQSTSVLTRNRCNEIRTICDDMEQEAIYVTFGHVRTDINATDCATRGFSKEEFEEHPWWNGPPFLSKDEAPERCPHSKLPSTMTTDQDGSLEVHQNSARATANALAQQSVQDLLKRKLYKSVARAGHSCVLIRLAMDS
ncbi:unnamed protein product [Heligmosomoides polygyrus]|uniref:RNase H domain-containing protein n=1 Tax=Heligmosomoides polygyrus TaxID=6339 RepID=A0A183F493_HELPZ|nr:unnamed protein product [Heligmosomoides polygyrus]